MNVETTQSAGATWPISNPRGRRRMVYTSDRSNILTYDSGRHVGTAGGRAEWAAADPTRTHDLTRFVDELAGNCVDTYAQVVFSQGWPLFFRSKHSEPCPQAMEQRLGLLFESGVTPLEVLIDRTHKQGMEFVAKFRMSDRHGGGLSGSRFILDNRQWQLREYPGALDYSFEPVRNHIFSMVQEVVEKFDVDGVLFNYIRWEHCFPVDVAVECQGVMTGFLGSVREMLDGFGNRRSKHLTLGVMVPQTLQECHNLGYDVPTWIGQKLIDYVCPCDFFYPDFNAKYEEFDALTRGSACMLYPALAPLLCANNRTTLLRPENYRALAQNFYAAGADGICIFNYMYHWARKGGSASYPGPHEHYPLALSYLRELRGPELFQDQPRHYRFHPLWTGQCPTRAMKDDKIVLARQDGSQGKYRFRLCEPLTKPARIVLYFTAQGLQTLDEIAVDLNGHEVTNFQRVLSADGRSQEYGRQLPAFSTVFFDVDVSHLSGKDNYLTVRLLESATGCEGDIVVDELEVVVIPEPT